MNGTIISVRSVFHRKKSYTGFVIRPTVYYRSNRRFLEPLQSYSRVWVNLPDSFERSRGETQTLGIQTTVGRLICPSPGLRTSRPLPRRPTECHRLSPSFAGRRPFSIPDPLTTLSFQSLSSGPSSFRVRFPSCGRIHLISAHDQPGSACCSRRPRPRPFSP